MIEMYKDELLSLTNDYVFRRVFAEKNPGALAEFLSAVTNIPIDELQSLEVDDPHLYREHEDGKSGEIDIRVHTKSGSIIHAEIQIRNEQAFAERIIFYSARLFSGQLKKGQEYIDLNKTISIVITDFVLLDENPDYFNTFRWYNHENGTLLSDMQEIDILELPKLTESDDNTQLWQWMKLLKLRRRDEMEALAKDNQAMKDVVVTIREMSADEAERMRAEAREKEIRDRLGQLGYAFEQGEKRGEKQGEKRGEKNNAIEIARQMKAKEYATDEIAELTKLTIAEIENL
jgi:predicted transposase/invertase (TIGR01784 family)